MMSDGAADFMIQVAVHPDCTDVFVKAHFAHGIHIIDTFISPSKELAILTRGGCDGSEGDCIAARNERLCRYFGMGEMGT